MHNTFKVASLSYKNAPLEIRELIAFDESEAKKLLDLIGEYSGISEALVLSTCNRTEIYYSSVDDQFELLIKLIGLAKGLDASLDIANHFDHLSDHNFAVQHLFDVALGLEAQVVGDLQIINQVKSAYQWSADQDMAGPFLHRLLHAVFYTNKRVVQETAFRDGAASVSYAAVESIDQLTAAIPQPKILVIGLGEIGEDVARNLEYIKEKEVWVSNRTIDKANELASEFGYHVVPFDDVMSTVGDMDVIVSSVNMPELLIDESWFSADGILSHKYLFDLSVPRSIDPNIEKVNGLLLYNIDSIEAQATAVLDKRMAAVPDVRSIIAEAMIDFGNWAQEMEVSPVINKLKNALEDIRKNEIARHVKNLPDDQNELIETVTKNMMQKIIKLPVLQLKAACKRGEADSLIEVLNDLFNLEQAPDKIQK